MTDYFWPTAFSAWGDEERSAMSRVIASGRYTMAGEVEAFEHEFAAFHGMKFGIMVNSGSSANLLSVAALFLKEKKPLNRNDWCVVPAMAWSTTYAPLVQYGLRLCLVDADATWNAADECVQWRPSIVVACSILGNPANLPYWKEKCEKSGAYLLEDNCESLGAAVGGKLCGTFGIMNTFSFFYSHQLSAIEGGMILTDDAECAKLCRMLRDHGMTRSLGEIQDFNHEYDFRMMGYNVRPLEMHAAIAREQLKKLPRFVDIRRTNYNYFVEQVSRLDLPVRFQRPNGSQSPFGIPFTCNTTEARKALVTAFRSNGIDCRLPTGGSFLKHAYGAFWRYHLTPTADNIHDTGMFIGCPPFPAEDQIDRIISVMKSALL